MLGWVSLDTLYLSVKYPKADVFKQWWPHAAEVDPRMLKQGVPVGDAVLRRGASGYAMSVWRGDARAYLTNQVDEQRGEGNGMGIWLQLGPRFLGAYRENLSVGVSGFLRLLGVVGDWPARVTRLDLAVDLPGVEMDKQSVEDWRHGWVGRSKVSGAFFNSRTGRLETINVGSRRSAVFLRVYDKVAQAEKEGDMQQWREVWDLYPGPVCRVEWETKPARAGFEGVADFDQWKTQELVKLANYLIEWGRLCVPSRSDSNNRRWALAPLWMQLESVVDHWRAGDLELAERKEHAGIEPSVGFVRFLSGAVSSGMARLGQDGPSLMKMLDGMEEFGWPMRRVQERAEEKALVLRILSGLGPKSDGPAPARSGGGRRAGRTPSPGGGSEPIGS